MNKNLYVAAILLTAGATILCPSAVSAQVQDSIELPSNARYVIVGDSLQRVLPSSCDKQYSFRWYRNGVLTKVTTPSYIVEPNINLVGKTYTYQRTALCGGCPPLYRSPLFKILTTEPIDTLKLDCHQTRVVGSYLQHADAQQTGSYVTLSVTSTSPKSVAWQMETNSVKGLYFKGSGMLAPGKNTIKLNAYGTPLLSGINHFELTISAGKLHVANTCAFDLYVAIPSITVALISSTSGQWCQSCATSAIPMIISNRAINGYFDNPAYSKLGTIKYTTSTSGIATANVLFWGYDKKLAAAERADIARYVKTNGLPSILCVGTENYDKQADYQAWIRSSFGDAGINVVTTNAAANDGVPFVAGSPVVAGPYMNIAGQKLFPDLDGNLDFTNVNENVWWIIAERQIGLTRYARAIMHKQYPIILIGDGGALSGGYGYTAADAQPVGVNSSGVPLPRITSQYPSPGTYNGHFLLNALLWAINQNAGK
jgi:hypothetical protein